MWKISPQVGQGNISLRSGKDRWSKELSEMEGVRLFRDGVDVIDTAGVGTETNEDLLDSGELAVCTVSIWLLVFSFFVLKEKILFK